MARANGRSAIPRLILGAVLLAGSGVASSAVAGTVEISGTRTNVTPGGGPGRCEPAITVGFAPGAFVAEGLTNLGAFSYTASHCIAAPPPGPYYDGQFKWMFDNGTLSGTYMGELLDSGVMGLFNITESILFTGGTGRYAGASGSAFGTGTVQFGLYEGSPASFGNFTFEGTVTAPGIPEPASWAMLIVGFGLVGGIVRRNRSVLATA